MTTPYDTGQRLEPKLWVKDGIAGSENPRPAQPDDYGRIDFEDDGGSTVFTAWMQKTHDGYILRIDEFSDVELTIETSSDRQAREVAMQRIDQGLREIALSRPIAVVYHDDGDISAFDHGNYQLLSERDDRNGFYVTEEYVGTDPYEDVDAVPNSWLYHVESVQREAGKLDCIVRTSEGRVTEDTLPELFEAVTQWVNTLPEDAIVQDSPAVSIRQQLEGAGIQYPAATYWDEMGSSEKDLWEERQLKALNRANLASSPPQPEPPQNYPSM